jgi:putative transcriptional regulator
MRKELFQKKLGEKITSLRMEKKISRATLANICGKDCQSLERIENGKINPSAFYLKEIAEGLNVPVKALFEF